MSKWTHITGFVRIDTDNPEKIKFPDDLKDEDFYYRIIDANDFETEDRYGVIFFGDMRRFTDLDRIIEYFKKFVEFNTKKEDFDDPDIRSGIIEIDLEFEKKIILHFDINSNNFLIAKKLIYDTNKEKYE